MSPATIVDVLVVVAQIGAVAMLGWGCLVCVGILGRRHRRQAAEPMAQPRSLRRQPRF
jgi:hypothetical protein